MNAKIINNTPCCPLSEQHLGKMTGEYKQVFHEGKSLTQFERYCGCGCRKTYIYQAEILLDETIRYNLDNVEEFKEI